MSKAFHRPLLSVSKMASLCHHSPGEPQAPSAVPKHTDPIWSGFKRELSKPRSPLIHHFCVHLHFIYWCQRFTHVANHDAWGQWCHQMHLIYKCEQVLGNAGKTRWQLFTTCWGFFDCCPFSRKAQTSLSFALNNKPACSMDGSLLITAVDSSICDNYRKHKNVAMWHQNRLVMQHRRIYGVVLVSKIRVFY